MVNEQSEQKTTLPKKKYIANMIPYFTSLVSRALVSLPGQHTPKKRGGGVLSFFCYLILHHFANLSAVLCCRKMQFNSLAAICRIFKQGHSASGNGENSIIRMPVLFFIRRFFVRKRNETPKITRLIKLSPQTQLPWRATENCGNWR